MRSREFRAAAVFSLALALTGTAAAQDLDEAVIPRKTEIFVQLGRAINSKTAQAGDKFFSQVTVPVTIDDKIIIPAGSYVIGHVAESARAGRTKGKSQLRLGWDTVILPSGVTRKIEAVLSSAEGHSSRLTDEDGKVTAEGGQGGEVGKGAAGGGTVGAIGGAIGGGLSGAATGAAVGAGAGGLLALFKRGKPVVLPKGATITIQLENDIRFVKAVPSKPVRKLEKN